MFSHIVEGKRIWKEGVFSHALFVKYGLGYSDADFECAWGLLLELGFQKSGLHTVFSLGEKVEGSFLLGRVEVIPYFKGYWLVRSKHVTTELKALEDLLGVIRERWSDE